MENNKKVLLNDNNKRENDGKSALRDRTTITRGEMMAKTTNPHRTQLQYTQKYKKGHKSEVI